MQKGKYFHYRKLSRVRMEDFMFTLVLLWSPWLTYISLGSHWYESPCGFGVTRKRPRRQWKETVSPFQEHVINTYLGNSQLVFFRAFLRIRAGIVFTEGNDGVHSGLVNGLDGELRAEKVAHCPQGRAHVGGQRRVCQEVGDEAVSLAHHGNVHSDTGSWRLRHQTQEVGRERPEAGGTGRKTGLFLKSRLKWH